MLIALGFLFILFIYLKVFHTSVIKIRNNILSDEIWISTKIHNNNNRTKAELKGILIYLIEDRHPPMVQSYQSSNPHPSNDTP